MILKLCYYGDPILRKRSAPIEHITDEIRQLAVDMVETMDKNNGLGLSGCQIGKPIRLFVLRNYVETPDGKWAMSAPSVFINPKILSVSDEVILDREGCLSIPGIRGEVQRPLKVTVEATDMSGKVFIEESTGYNARCRLHENDHLNGVLFIDRISSQARKKIDPLLREIKKKYAQ